MYVSAIDMRESFLPSKSFIGVLHPMNVISRNRQVYFLNVSIVFMILVERRCTRMLDANIIVLVRFLHIFVRNSSLFLRFLPFNC